MRIKPLIFGLALVSLVFFTVTELGRELHTDEERVRDALLDAVDEFNDQDLSDTLSLFAQEYRDEDEDHDRDAVRESLFYLFWHSGDRFHATLREEQLVMNVDAESGTVTVSLGVAITRGRGGQYQPWWNLEAEVDMQLQKGKHWRIVASRGVNHDERDG